jgi:hypothetical protein
MRPVEAAGMVNHLETNKKSRQTQGAGRFDHPK